MSYPSMYCKLRKLETASPKAEQDENLTSRDKDDKDNHISQFSRPRSAKLQEKRFSQPQKKKITRPISAKKILVNIGAKLAVKPQPDNYLLSRLKPTYISIDKERLYEDNMALKLALNAFQTENVKLKTRNTQLEREISKKDDLIDELSTHEKHSGHKNIHLINSLKQAIRENKIEIKTKEEEISKLKKHIRSSKVTELEVEIQTYVNECSRLKHHLEEIINRKGEFYILKDEDSKSANDMLGSLRKEKQELVLALNKSQDELKKFQQEIEKPNKKTGAVIQQQAAFKLEIQKLKTQLEFNAKGYKDREIEMQAAINNEKAQLQEIKSRLEKEEKMNKELTKKIDNLKQEMERLTETYKSLIAKASSKPVPISEPPKAVAKEPNFLELVKNHEKEFETKINVAKTDKNLNSDRIPKIASSSAIKPEQKLLNPPKILKIIYKILTEKNLTIQKFIAIITERYTITIEIDELVEFFKGYNKTVSPKYFESFIISKLGKKLVDMKKVADDFDKYEYISNMSSSDEKPLVITTQGKIPTFNLDSSPEVKIELIRENEISHYLNHISLCMQLHRIERKELGNTIFGVQVDLEKKISRAKLIKCFQNPPFMFLEKISIDRFCEFLTQPTSEALEISRGKKFKFSKKEILNKINQLITDWEIFDSDEESTFDMKLGQIISKNKKKIKDICKGFDTFNLGVISIEQFKLAIKDYSELLKTRIFQYMTLLFYSHEYELNQVPYIHFIKAYGEQNKDESQEYTDEEREMIVKHHLNEIAVGLKKNKCTVREVFQVDNSLIYPESFIAGLEYLGLKNIEHDFVVLILDALQYEKEDEACILVEEFEKIMENYGVNALAKSHKSSSNKSSNRSQGLKKISIEDSENYEYSDDSPEKHRISEISPFNSVSAIGKQPANPTIKGVEKQYEKHIAEKSSNDSKQTPAVSKIETIPKNYSISKSSSSDSIRDILKRNDSPEKSSSSFDSRKKNQPVILTKEIELPEAKSGTSSNSKQYDYIKEYEDEEFEDDEANKSGKSYKMNSKEGVKINVDVESKPSRGSSQNGKYIDEERKDFSLDRKDSNAVAVLLNESHRSSGSNSLYSKKNSGSRSKASINLKNYPELFEIHVDSKSSSKSNQRLFNDSAKDPSSDFENSNLISKPRIESTVTVRNIPAESESVVFNKKKSATENDSKNEYSDRFSNSSSSSRNITPLDKLAVAIPKLEIPKIPTIPGFSPISPQFSKPLENEKPNPDSRIKKEEELEYESDSYEDDNSIKESINSGQDEMF